MKSNFLKNNNFKRTPNASVHACYDTNLVFKLILEKFINKKSRKNIFGTKRFNFEPEEEYPDISVAEIEDFGYLAYYFILIAKRYYRRLFKLQEKDIFDIPSEGQNCINIRYLISLIEIAIKSKPKSKFLFHCPSSGNKIIDKLFKKHYLRKHSINIRIHKFSRIIKPSNDLNFDYKKLSIDKTSFIKPILKTKNINTSNIANKGFIHHKNFSNQQAYYKLKKDLSIANNFISLDYLSMYQYGNQKKIQLFINIIKYSFNLLKKNIWNILLQNLFSVILEIISCKIYYLCCINSIKSLKLKYLICSYISFKHEKILFQACRDTDTISIFYDFSMGFPVNKNYPGNSQIDIIRNPNYLITFGSQRCEQYKAVKRLKREFVEIKNALCPQIEFAREQIKQKCNFNKKRDIDKYKSNSIKISIFDNLYGFNYHIKEIDILSCIDSLEISTLKKVILIHNKRDGFLEKYIKTSNLIYIFQEKANFTNSYHSDFIISLGFQGAAIKSAFAFHKPIIFFSENRNFFNEAYFFFDKNQNEKILLIINELTFNGDTFMKSISNKSEYINFIKKIELFSKKLFSELKLDNLDSAQKIIHNIIN